MYLTDSISYKKVWTFWRYFEYILVALCCRSKGFHLYILIEISFFINLLHFPVKTAAANPRRSIDKTFIGVALAFLIKKEQCISYLLLTMICLLTLFEIWKCPFLFLNKLPAPFLMVDWYWDLRFFIPFLLTYFWNWLNNQLLIWYEFC